MKCINNCGKEFVTTFCNRECYDNYYKNEHKSEKMETGKVECYGVEKTFDLDKAMKNGGKCKTRDGRDARIICTDRLDTIYPLIVLIRLNNEEKMFDCTKEGRYKLDEYNVSWLVNIPETRTLWLNVYINFLASSVFESKEMADSHSQHRVACIKVEYQEGDGFK